MTLPRLLQPIESRILGALLEKSQATPDYYPMTVKALVAACNQKNNRDPVTSYSEGKVRHALEELRGDVLVWRTDGARVDRWNESITRRLSLKPPHRAILTLLLLRGPQTVGELRTRSVRLHSFESLSLVEAALDDLQQGSEPVVQELPRQPGHKETRWRHLLGEDATEPPVEAMAAPVLASSSARPSTPVTAGRTAQGESIEKRVTDLERQLEDVLCQLRELQGRSPQTSPSET